CSPCWDSDTARRIAALPRRCGRAALCVPSEEEDRAKCRDHLLRLSREADYAECGTVLGAREVHLQAAEAADLLREGVEVHKVTFDVGEEIVRAGDERDCGNAAFEHRLSFSEVNQRTGFDWSCGSAGGTVPHGTRQIGEFAGGGVE